MGKMTDVSVKDMEFFEEDINSMYSDAKELKDLADKVQKDLDGIYFDNKNKDMIGRGVLPFVSEQLKTLASIRSSRSSALNQILSNKLKIAQLSLAKEKSAAGGGAGDPAAIAKEFQKMFLDPANKHVFNVQSPHSIKDDVDSALSSRISELSTSGDLKFTDNELAMKYENIDVEIVIMVDGGCSKFVAIDRSNNNILDDYPQTLLPKVDVLTDAKDVNGYKKCKNGSIYRIFN